MLVWRFISGLKQHVCQFILFPFHLLLRFPLHSLIYFLFYSYRGCGWCQACWFFYHQCSICGPCHSRGGSQCEGGGGGDEREDRKTFWPHVRSYVSDTIINVNGFCLYFPICEYSLICCGELRMFNTSITHLHTSLMCFSFPYIHIGGTSPTLTFGLPWLMCASRCCMITLCPTRCSTKEPRHWRFSVTASSRRWVIFLLFCLWIYFFPWSLDSRGWCSLGMCTPCGFNLPSTIISRQYLFYCTL